MAARTDLPPAVAAVVETGIALIRRAPSARVAIARAAGVVDLASVPSDVRDALEAEFEAARDAVIEPISPKEVEKALREAWRKPAKKVLDDLDLDAPLAITPGAQVHRGSIDGADVAVKVRRPGLERAVRNDLALLDVLAGPLGSAFPRLDAGALLRDVREAAMDELDFEYEASNARRVARALRGVEGIAPARPHTDISTPEVLVSDLLPGTTLADGASVADPLAAAHALIAVHRAATLDAGLAPVDPRPSHVVVAPDGTLGLLGLGVSRPVDRARARLALQAFAALTDDDAERFGDTVGESGLLEAAVAREVLPVLRAVAGELIDGPAKLDARALRAGSIRAADATPALARVAMSGAPIPQDMALARMLAQLIALLARLEATDTWPHHLRGDSPAS